MFKLVLLLYMINSIHCEDILFPGEESEPDTKFDENLYSEDEKKCFALRKVWYVDRCQPLVRDGPCEAGKWLVFDPDSELLKAVCQDKPCDVGEVWWPNTGKCELKTTIKSTECTGRFKDVYVDIKGEGVCRCRDGYGTRQDEEICFEYYQQGPCLDTEVFTYDQDSGYGVCTKDRCYSENQPKRTNPRARAVKVPKTYAPLEGNGTCYKFGSSEPCSIVHEQSRFIVDTVSNTPRCSVPNKQLFVVDAPLLCRVGSDNRCQSQISISQQDRSSYINDIKKQLNKRG